MSEHKPTQEKSLFGGTQKVYRFNNGYGASVIRHAYSRGTELAVLKWEGDDFEIAYDTPITDDVIGHLSPFEVDEVLYRIAALTEGEPAGGEVS